METTEQKKVRNSTEVLQAVTEAVALYKHAKWVLAGMTNQPTTSEIIRVTYDLEKIANRHLGQGDYWNCVVEIVVNINTLIADSVRINTKKQKEA